MEKLLLSKLLQQNNDRMIHPGGQGWQEVDPAELTSPLLQE